MAASNRMTEKFLATWRIVWIIALPGFRIEEIDLSGVVPGHGGSVVAVIDVPLVPGVGVEPLEGNRCVRFIVVVIFDINRDPGILGEVFSGIGIPGEWRKGELDKPVGMICHPFGVDAGMVRDHIACKPYTSSPAPLFQIVQGVPSS